MNWLDIWMDMMDAAFGPLQDAIVDMTFDAMEYWGVI